MLSAGVPADGGPAVVGVHLTEGGGHPKQGLIHHGLDAPDGMTLRQQGVGGDRREHHGLTLCLAFLNLTAKDA